MELSLQEPWALYRWKHLVWLCEDQSKFNIPWGHWHRTLHLMLLIKKGKQAHRGKQTRLPFSWWRSQTHREARGVRLWQGEETQNRKSPASYSLLLPRAKLDPPQSLWVEQLQSLFTWILNKELSILWAPSHEPTISIQAPALQMCPWGSPHPRKISRWFQGKE